MSEQIKEKTAACREELLRRLAALVAIPSVQSEATEDAPFGTGPKEALACALDFLKEDGFRTVNLDNYAGYAEMGEGSEVVGVVGHLDVVPAAMEDGWNTDPFVMHEEDGILYGRGVSDDKGAVVCSMMAMKIIRDLGIPLKRRVRLIMGTNEETGSACLRHYVEKEGSVDYGFTPDGEFPGVHGEKGMIQMIYRSKETGILEIKGGSASNVVPRHCEILVNKCTFSKKKLEDFFHNNNIEFSLQEEENGMRLAVTGTAAHASTPQLGVNAISWLLCGLKEAGFQDPFVDFYTARFGLNTDGRGLGIACHDKYGDLTLNNGVIKMKNGRIAGTVDIRFPVTMTSKNVLKPVVFDYDNGTIEVVHTAEPLFYDIESPLVKSLLEAYQEVTGDYETQPMTMGGGTYAKGIDNTIAFGCAFPGKDYHIHDANEWVPVEDLLKQVEIYVTAIIRLAGI